MEHQSARLGRFSGQAAGLNLTTNTAHPIKFTTYTNEFIGVPASMQILGTGTRDVEISAPLTVSGTSTFTGQVILNNTLMLTNMKPAGSGGLNILKLDGTPAAKIHATGTAQFYSNVLADGNLTVAGDLTVSGFTSAKPFASLRVITSTALPAVASTGTTAALIGTPGTVSLTQYGFLTNVSCSRGVPATANLFLYSFTMPTAHPLGVNYIVSGCFQTGATSSPSPNAFLSFNVSSATQFSVWVRSSTNILLDGSFFVYTVP